MSAADGAAAMTGRAEQPWDIERDVLRGRDLDYGQTFLPDALSLADRLEFLNDIERRFVSQVQGRTYANMLGLFERAIGAKILELCDDQRLGDRGALQALVRFAAEELKHQELFGRVESLIGQWMPPGYVFDHDRDDAARVLLGKSTWAVLALTYRIELQTVAHYHQAIEPDPTVAELFKDVFRHHAAEEVGHIAVDEAEWRREDALLGADERAGAVDDFLALLGAVDAVLCRQAALDTAYVVRSCGYRFAPAEVRRIASTMLAAYRAQYTPPAASCAVFTTTLGDLVSPAELARIDTALAAFR